MTESTIPAISQVIVKFTLKNDYPAIPSFNFVQETVTGSLGIVFADLKISGTTCRAWMNNHKDGRLVRFCCCLFHCHRKLMTKSFLKYRAAQRRPPMLKSTAFAHV